MTAAAPEDRPLLFGRFRVLEVITDDPIERVVRCLDTQLGREVLLESGGSALDKLPTVDGSARALREARVLAAIDHPGLPKVYDVVADEHGVVLVVESFGGETLARRLERAGPLPGPELRRLALEVAQTLAIVHGEKAVHRALATRNVVLRADGSAVLRGFRFAKFVAVGHGFSSLASGRSQAVVSAMERAGLPPNPAPEQFAGSPACVGTDLFALGCVLYEAACGRPPFEDLYAQGWVAPAPLRSLAPDIEPDLARVIERCLARTPVGRPSSAGEIVAALSARPEPRVRGGAATRATAAVSVTLAIVAVALQGPWRRGADGGDATRGVQAAAPASGSVEERELSAGFERSHALLVGISDYVHFGDLPNARADIEALAARLRTLPGEWGITVVAPEETTRAGVAGAIEGFVSVLRDRPNDRALVYYAGHGMSDPQNRSYGWLVPSDGRENDPTSWIELDDFRQVFDRSQAKHVLVALDCCYGGSGITTRGLGSTLGSAADQYTRRRAHAILTSGRGMEQVSDGAPGQSSPFARAFLEALALDRAILTSSALFVHVQTVYERERVTGQVPMLQRLPDSSAEFVFHLR